MKSIYTIEDSLYTWASGQLPGVPILWYHQNMPRPKVPYVAFHLKSIRAIGVDARLSPSHAGVMEIVGNRDFTLECQAIGNLGDEYLEKLIMSLEKPTVQAALRANDLAVVDRTPIMDIAELVDNRYEERNVVDLFFRFAQTDSDNPGVIEILNDAKFDAISPDLITITENLITVP